MVNEKIREGFYFFGANHDFFVETDQQIKSRKLARKIAEAISFEVNDYTIETIFRRLQKAHCKIPLFLIFVCIVHWDAAEPLDGSGTFF